MMYIGIVEGNKDKIFEKCQDGYYKCLNDLSYPLLTQEQIEHDVEYGCIIKYEKHEEI